MRLRSFLACCALATAAWMASTPPALAAPTKAELSRARAKFQQATELEQAGNYASALDAFREVGQVKMTPQVRYHIAHCEEKLGRLLTALGGYELAASDAAAVDPGFEKEVKARLEDLKARIPKLSIKRGKGAAAAQIELDGVALGASSVGAALPVDPGPHEVTAKAAGKSPFSATVELVEKDEKTVEVAFSESAPVAGSVSGGGDKDRPRDEGVEKPPSKVLPFVIGGVGVASLAASGVFFLMKNNAVNDLESACGPNGDQCPPDKQKTYDNAKLYNTLSMVTLGVGVVGVGVATTLLLTQKPSKDKPAKEKSAARLELVPIASPAHAGVSLFGAF